MPRIIASILRLSLLVITWLLTFGASAFAVCQLISDARPDAFPVIKAALQPGEVQIRYLGHSTFEIETPGGIIINTDYSGAYRSERLPHVVTMNGAHSSHFTLNPDPGIEHVLFGWNPEGGPIDHDLMVGDVRIRNIQTNTRGWDGTTHLLGNSIFIFEIADLCMAHLGHLHQRLLEEDLTRLGKIDIVFVPVDGSATLSHDSMIAVLKSIGAPVVIPMHAFTYGSLQAFSARMAENGYTVELSESPTYLARRTTLPANPTFLMLPGI